MRTWIHFLAVVALLPCASRQVEGACGTCHPGVKTDYRQSVHSEDFGCPVCHGGDPTAMTLEAHAVAKGYLGTPARQDIPRLCASCHADPTRMRPFGLPTDQYAQYQTSEHGRQLARGDTRVAVCTDCHGAHRILPPEEPTSPVARRNIAATCGHCHSDHALMAAYSLPADQVQQFCQSVHGVALLVEDHPSAPTCATCHGAHGAAAPQVGSIRRVCGHCHQRTREYFDESPHRKATDAGKMSECVSCHGYHDTAPPDLTLFDTACRKCHARGSAAFLTGQKLKTVLSRAREAIEAAAAELARVDRLFPTVVRYRPRLQQARASYLEALPVQHSLAMQRVDDLTRSARSTAEDVQASVHAAEQASQLRYIVLGGAWLFILFTAGVAYLYKRERSRDHADTGQE
ncbi:MAG: hypothetical protein ACE5I7_02785 [Candidatus Binatia bacterium]